MRAYNPKPTLKANFYAGEGEIGNLDEFRKHDTLMRLDLLKDWIYDLEQEYNRTFEEHQERRKLRRIQHGQG
jgi:hypothetical protein